MNVTLNRIAAFTAVSLMLLAGAAQAGHLGRPDLMLIDDTYSDTRQPAGVNGSAFLYMSDSYVSGSIDITVTNGTTSAGFGGEIQDFDKATKTPRNSELRNKMWTFVNAFTYESEGSNSSVGSTSMKPCKMRIAAKDVDADQDSDQARWMMGCNSRVLDDLGMGASAQTRFLALFKELKAKGVNARNLSYSGKGPVD